MDAAAKVAALFADELERGGKVADQAAGAITGAAGAVDKLEAAETEAAGSATRTADALESVGIAGQQAGDRASGSAQETRAALDGATAAAVGERAALEAAGNAGKASATEIAGGFEKAGAAIRESGLALEVQRAGLMAVLSESEKLTASYIKQGEEGKEGANASATATLKLKANLADVNAEIGKEIDRFRQLGSQGEASFGQISGAALSFDGIATGATDRVNAAWRSLNEDFRLTPKQLALVAQAVELLKLEMVEMSERGQVATLEQIEVYERLEVELTRLTVKTNQLTNAASDNAARLKETGNQVAGVAMGVQQLSAALGPNAAKVGMLVGNVGQLAGAYEGMKDSVAAMNLTQLSAGNSAATMGVQVTAVIAAFLAGAAAGKKFSDVTAENADVMDRYVEKIKEWVKVDATDWIDGFNLSMQASFEKLGNAETALDGYLELLTLVPALANDGGNAIRFQTAAIRDGLTEQQASAIAAKNGAEAWKFYETAVRGGADGYKLWSQAIEAGKSGADAFSKFLADNKEKLAAVAKATEEAAKKVTILAAAQEAYNNSLLRGVDMVTANSVAVAQAISDATKFEVATNGTTASINLLLAEIQRYVEMGPAYSANTNVLAAALDAVLVKTTALTPAQRENIAAVSELAKKSSELTEAERKNASQLIANIEAGNKVTAAIVERKAATESLAAAVTTLAGADSAASVAEETRTSAIRAQLELIREQIAEEERRQGVAKKDIQVNNDRGLSIDGLRQQEAALARELESSITVWHAADEAKTQEVETYAEMAAALTRQSQGYAGVKSAAGELHAVLENGQVVWTNVTTKADEAATATMKVKTTTESLGVAIEGFKDRQIVMSGGLNALTSDAERLNIELEKVAENIRKVNDEAEKAAEGVA